jgi:hypothetical protein
MAHDLLEKKDVELKVMSSWPWAENEVRMHRKIARTVKDAKHLVVALAGFTLPVPVSGTGDRDGNAFEHQVLVLPLIGSRINWHTLVKLSMAQRMSAARQLLEALESLHAAGIVHRGKWKFIFLTLRSLMLIKYLYRCKRRQLHVGNDPPCPPKQKR